MAGKTRMGWALAMAGVLAAGPLVLGRGNPALSNSHEKISVMSEVDRAVLKRKYDEYRALTESQRADLRTLHSQIERDRTSGPRYLEIMTLYCDWLKTIDAWQQDELAHMIDKPQEKSQRVASIMRERTEKAAAADGHDDDGPPGIGPFQLPRLNEGQLTKVFDVLANRFTLTEEEQKEIDKLHGLKRFGVQIRYLQKKSIANPEKFFRSISEAELTQIIEASGNTDINALLSGTIDVDVRRKRAIRAIFTSCWTLSLQESSSATDQELRDYFNTLPPDVQDELLQMQADQFMTQLRLRHFESDPDVSELKHLMGQEFSGAKRRMERFRSGPGPNGPGGASFDPRRDGERDGPPRPFRDQFGKNPRPRPGNPDGPPPDGPDGERRPPPP